MTRLSLAFIALLLLPGFVLTTLGSESASPGAAISYVLVILLSYSTRKVSGRLLSTTKLIMLIYFMAFCLSLFGGVIAGTAFDYNKMFLSFSLAVLQIYAAGNLYKQLLLSRWESVDRALSITTSVMTLVGTYYGIQFMVNPSGPRMFFFNEPSHYAFCFAPFIIYYLLCMKNLSCLIFGCIIFTLSWLLHNSTLLIIVAYGFFLRTLLYNNYVGLIFLLVLAPVILFSGIHEGALLRFSGVFNSENDLLNLSSLVYVQGWESIYSVLKNGFLLGIGYNQMGNLHLDTVSGNTLMSMGAPLNLNDGSFLLSKLTVEFGILGIVAFLMQIKIMYDVMRFLRTSLVVGKEENCYHILMASLCFAFLITLVVRNTNYFGSPITFFAVFLYYQRNRKFENSRMPGVAPQ